MTQRHGVIFGSAMEICPLHFSISFACWIAVKSEVFTYDFTALVLLDLHGSDSLHLSPPLWP